MTSCVNKSGNFFFRDVERFLGNSCYHFVTRISKHTDNQEWAHFASEYLSRNHYGNEDTGNKIDEFWLADKGGKLRITMQEQIAFLQKLYDEDLKFSKRSQQLVKGIMLDDQETKEYSLYGKTAAANYDGMSYGWYVGWIESRGNVYFFATLIETPDPKKILTGGRKGITLAIFEELKNKGFIN